MDAAPHRWSLWRARCPDNAELRALAGPPLPEILSAARTAHWFDPCELLGDDARSELKPSCRTRAVGGGWEPA